MSQEKQATEHLLQVSPETARDTVAPPYSISHLSCCISHTHTHKHSTTQHNTPQLVSQTRGCIHLDGIKVEFASWQSDLSYSESDLQHLRFTFFVFLPSAEASADTRHHTIRSLALNITMMHPLFFNLFLRCLFKEVNYPSQ